MLSNCEGINGLYYIENYLDEYNLNDVKKFIQNVNLEHIGNRASRRVAHYGYYYSYDRSGLKTAPQIPVELNNLIYLPLLNDVNFDQIIINEYKPGQKIAYHTDHQTLFGPIIACITVGQEVPIYFKYGKEIKQVIPKEGSMYIMTGEGRYKWQHMSNNDTSGTRYSITYRTIN